MRHTIGTGTDAAMVCFFDTAALPADFDEQMQKEAFETMEKLAADGRMRWVKTDGDGGYLFHFYVNTDMPETIQKHCTDQEMAEVFHVPSGTIWACGAEYAALDPMTGGRTGPKGGLQKYAHMGGSFKIESGDYTLKMWRTEWPEGALEQALERTLGKYRLRRENRLGTIAGVFFLATCIVTVVVLALTVHHPGLTMAWTWLAVLALWAACVTFLKRVNRMQSPERQAVELEFPSIIVQLTSKPRS